MKAAIWQDRASGSWNLSLYVDGVLDTDCSLAKGGEATDLCKAATNMGFKLNEIVVMKQVTGRRRPASRPATAGESGFQRLWRRVSGG